METKRRYLPTFAEIIDRLTILYLKESFLPEFKTRYAQEIEDIIHDIDLILKEEKIKVNGDMIFAVAVLSAINLTIWTNEANCRKNGSTEGTNLVASHSCNSIRNLAKNIIQSHVGHGRQDYKLDCLTTAAKHFLPTKWSKEEGTYNINDKS